MIVIEKTGRTRKELLGIVDTAILLVPLADLFESRRLALCVMAVYRGIDRRGNRDTCRRISAGFGAFTLFWTVAPLWLTGPVFGLSQIGVALFALAGGPVPSTRRPGAGWRTGGWTRSATGLGMLAVAVAFLITHIAEPGSSLALGFLVAAILLDFGRHLHAGNRPAHHLLAGRRSPRQAQWRST